MAFRYQARRRLYTYLGEYDALVQLEEVARRRFTADIRASEDTRGYVISEATRFGINVKVDASAAMMLNAARTNIVVVYQSADQYFAEFRREHEELFGKSWGPKADGDSSLEYAMRSLQTPYREVEGALTPLRIEIFDYYRLVRNLVTHRYDPDDEGDWGEEADVGRHRKRLDAKLKRIRERFAEQLPEFTGRLAAPNDYDALTFDDFVLATRNMKHLATALSDISRPPDEALLAALDSDVRRFYRTHSNQRDSGPPPYCLSGQSALRY